MKRIRVLGWMVVLTIVLFSIPSNVRAHEPHVCPNGYPDAPVLPGHIDQRQIVDGTLTFNEIFAAGQDLFGAIFNGCDGQGRPATTGTGEKREPDEPDFIRTSAPDAKGVIISQDLEVGVILSPMSSSWRKPWTP